MKVLSSLGMALWAVLAVSTAAESATPIGVILAVGDITSCEPEEMDRARATATVVGREIDRYRREGVPVKVMLLGDMAYVNGTQKQYRCFDRTWGKVLRDKLADRNVDVLPVPGNHDYRTSDAIGYRSYFADNKWVLSSEDFYYGLTFPENDARGWKLLGLNSEIEDKDAQLDWFKSALSANKQRCVLGFWHRPVFSSGYHGHGENGDGEDVDLAPPVKQVLMAQEEALLASAGGSLVINGHDHNYEELAPHTEQGEPSANGLRSIVVGTGGRELRAKPDLMWTAISRNFDAETHGILKLTLFPDSYASVFLPADGGEKYAATGTCNFPHLQ